jgi:hypothetical protein
MTDQQLIEAARQAGLCFPDCWDLELSADDIAAENRWVEDGQAQGPTISQTRRQILEVGDRQRNERLQQLRRFVDLIQATGQED